MSLRRTKKGEKKEGRMRKGARGKNGGRILGKCRSSGQKGEKENRLEAIEKRCRVKN